MFNYKSLLTFTLVALASKAAATVAPSKQGADTSPMVTLCPDVNPYRGGVNVPVVSDACVNLVGGLTFLNKEISSAIIPGGLVCTFFQDFGCFTVGLGNNNNQDAAVVLGEGTWNFGYLLGLSGSQNFNDMTSSFSCSPI
ncbi:hypothetical protein FB45DRAFT_1119815 [Roridomyces roridus]|uniref:Hydrophobin n=1 Tax=Roridomyces roridus TaxID=1738132 RepID=A0AAD7B648_9AGAR|nr:hypothetical protein FB45DRAFT_1119815 [Roridomyces roridus]